MADREGGEAGASFDVRSEERSMVEGRGGVGVGGRTRNESSCRAAVVRRCGRGSWSWVVVVVVVVRPGVARSPTRSFSRVGPFRWAFARGIVRRGKRESGGSAVEKFSRKCLTNSIRWTRVAKVDRKGK